MEISKFQDLDCWKVSRELVSSVYGLTKSIKIQRDYGFADQIQRASVSAAINIAEGFDSHSNKLFVNFLSYSYRSVSEIQALLYLALDLCYITQEDFNKIYPQTERAHKLIAGFSRYLKNSEL